MKSNKFLFPALILFFVACSNAPKPGALDTPISGKIPLSIDENVRSLSDELIDAFESSYPEAFLMQSYNSETNVLKELYDDSSRLAIMMRPLKPEEVKWFEAKTFMLEQIKIGSDAVVLLVNKENPDSLFTVDQIRDIISGKDSLWSQIRPGSTLGRINIVFDNPSSSNLHYLTDTLLGGKSPGKNCFAVLSNDSVIGYVNHNPNAMGVVGLNWIGDKDLPEDVDRKSRIKMARVGADTANYYYPSQSALAAGKYPFTRGIWIVKIGKRAGLGTGFASFALGERGQLIVQRCGLAPAKPAERKIEMTTY